MSTSDWCSDPKVPRPKDAGKNAGTVDVGYLCENGWQPLLITGFLRDLLARQWAHQDNIVAPELKQYVWREDKTSGILIESVFRYRPEVAGKRPAIMIKRNTFKVIELGIGSQNFGGGLAAYENEKGAITQYVVKMVGSHTLFCIHGTGASTEMLASEVFVHALECMIPIRRHLGLQKFFVAEIGAIQELQESKEHYVIPITIGWSYDHAWELREVSLPVQSISLTGLLGDTVALGTEYQGP